jgi:hypothetical protein
MAAPGPLEVVAAWIEGRLDLAFDDLTHLRVKS